jgi:SAM-dependent methyltransferase
MRHRIRRALGPVLRLLDLAVAAPLYLVVPRHARNQWATPGTVLRNRRAYDEVTALLGRAPRALVLDVGGGIAALAETLGSDSRVRVVTLDLDMEMLRRARAKFARAVLLRADGTRLPFADDTFDAVVMVHALEHIPQEIRAALAAEIKRVSRQGVVIHGPAGTEAVALTHRFIAALEARGMEVPRYAREHLAFSMPMPEWFSATFPGCRLQPRRNLEVEFITLLTAYTPVLRWLGGYQNRKLSAQDERPPFVEYTMTWKKPS